VFFGFFHVTRHVEHPKGFLVLVDPVIPVEGVVLHLEEDVVLAHWQIAKCELALVASRDLKDSGVSCNPDLLNRKPRLAVTGAGGQLDLVDEFHFGIGYPGVVSPNHTPGYSAGALRVCRCAVCKDNHKTRQ
jgi:hypothetical protein